MVVYKTIEDRCPAFLRSRRDARIVRLAEEVLWIAPGAAEPVVAIARGDWARVHANCPGLAAFDALPRARRRDLLAAWLADAPVGARASDGPALIQLLRERLVAADGMDAPAAVAAIGSLVAWVEQAPEGFITGHILDREVADIRTLYLDTRPTVDWPALARLLRPKLAPKDRDTSEYEVSHQRPADPQPARRPRDTSEYEVLSLAATRVGSDDAVWAFAFAPGFALDARALSAEEIDATEAAREARSSAQLRERQLTFSFFAGPLCATK